MNLLRGIGAVSSAKVAVVVIFGVGISAVYMWYSTWARTLLCGTPAFIGCSDVLVFNHNYKIPVTLTALHNLIISIW